MQGPEGAGFDYTKKIMLGLEPILAQYKADGEVESYLISSPGFGGGSFNSGNATLILKDWSERKRAADQIAQEINGKLRGQTGAQVNASIPGAFQRGGGGGGGNSNSVEMIVTGPEYEDIYRWLQPVLAARALSQDAAQGHHHQRQYRYGQHHRDGGSLRDERSRGTVDWGVHRSCGG